MKKKDLKKTQKLMANALDPWAGLELPKQPEPPSPYEYVPKPIYNTTMVGVPSKRVKDPTTGLILPDPSNPPKLKKISITKILEDKLLEWDKKTFKPKAEMIADKLIELAISGYFPAIQEVMDRIDGKITDVHKLEGMAPVTLIFEPAPSRDDRKLIFIEPEVKELTGGDSCQTR
jgi:hypothetical protein